MQIERITAVLLIWLLTTFATADDVAEKKIQQQIVEHWMNVSREHAKGYSITATGEQESAIQLHKHPVFQHIQVVRGNDIGAVHLWIDKDNRPAAIATIFAWTTGPTTRMLFHELHSLSDVPIETQHKGKPLWNSKIAGTNWKPVPNAGRPATTPRLRRVQASQIAKKFSSHMIDRERKRWELRAITTPVYEYDIQSDMKRGGAIFVFCRGTDIETMLVLEIRQHQDGPRWEFTCAKFTDYEPHMIYAGKDVWEPFSDAYLQNGNPHFWAPIETRPMPEVEKLAQKR